MDLFTSLTNKQKYSNNINIKKYVGKEINKQQQNAV